MEPDHNPEKTPTQAQKPYPVMVVVGLGTLLAAMAGSTINLALPALGREMGISIESSRWVVQAYLLATGVLILPVGRLSDILGHRTIYLSGFFVFGAASVACGLAGDFDWLVGFRMVQGLGGAMVMATGPALLTTSFPARMRGRALGMVATATYTGLTIGPPLGGAIVSALGWRWTFFLNLPVALLVLGMGLSFLPGRARRAVRGFDWTGALALLIGLPVLLLAISNAQSWGASAWQTWVTSASGLVAMVVFVWLQARSRSPLLDLSLFRSRVFTGAVVSAVANYIALFSVILLLPFYLEEGLGLDPARTGMLLSTQPLVMALVASPSGWLSDRLGSRGLAFAGMLVMAFGLFGLSGLDQAGSQAAVVAWLAVVGLGTGIFISPNSSALMGAAPRHQQGTAGSVLAESRILGMLIGVAVSTAVFQASGGQTGTAWRPADFEGFRLAELSAAGVALFGALAASLRGSTNR